jgi:hypothetical protein
MRSLFQVSCFLGYKLIFVKSIGYLVICSNFLVQRGPGFSLPGIGVSPIPGKGLAALCNPAWEDSFLEICIYQ